MDYPLKATWYLHGVESASTRCPDCPFSPIYTLEKTKECFKRCTFTIMVWLLDGEQEKIYEESRPPEMKRKDIEKAINERKIVQIEKVIGRAPEISVSPSFYQINKIYDEKINI